MKRFCDVFNLLGIGAMAWLCVAQWSANSQLGRQNDRLETIRQQQAAAIQTQQNTIKGQAQDLDEFRIRLAAAETQLQDLAKQLSQVTAERNQLAAERDRWAAALSQWQAAVKQRDELIAKAGSEIQSLAKQRNDAVAQFNDLANRYNELVKKSNAQ